MYLYVEQWNVTQKWMDLSKDERKKFMNNITQSMERLKEMSVENVGWAMNDEHTPHRDDYRYMAIWKIPTLADVEKFEKSLKDDGWYKYFSQENARGEIIPLNKAIDYLVNLEKHATSLND